MNFKKWVKIGGLVLGIGILVVVTGWMVMQLPMFAKKYEVDMNLPPMTKQELKKFNGTNPDLPIYLAYEGNIYDVTPGKEFYLKGETYNYLAGRDSTTELNIAGGGIIKTKYKIIARLVR